MVIKKCLKRSKSAKRPCKCNKQNEKFNLEASKQFSDTILKIKKNNAIAVMEQLKKNLGAITNELFAFDALSNEKNIKECNLESLEQRFKKCNQKDSLYSLLKDDPQYNIQAILKNQKDEIKAYYNKYKPKKGMQEVSCNIPDILTSKISNRVQLEAFEILIKNFDFSSKLSISEQTDQLKNKEHAKDFLDRFYELKRNPLFSSLMSNPELTKSALNHSPMNTLFKDNKKVKESIKSGLIKKCSQTYNKAFESLCQTKKDQALVTDYKDFASRTYISFEDTESPEKESRLAESLQYFCKEKDNEKNIDITKQNEDLNAILNLPPIISKLKHVKFDHQNYSLFQHKPRAQICDSIAPNGKLSESLKQCNDTPFNTKCSMLRAYKAEIESAYQTKIASTGTQTGSISASEPIDENTATSGQQQVTQMDLDSINPAELFQNNTSELITNFLGDKKPSGPKEEKSAGPKVTTNNNTESKPEKASQKTAKSSNYETNDISHQGINKENSSQRSLTKSETSPFSQKTDIPSGTVASENSHTAVKKWDNTFFKRMFKKSPKKSAKNAIQNIKRKVSNVADTISQKAKERKKEDYTDSLMASSFSPSYEDFYDEGFETSEETSFLKNEQAIDSHNAPNSIQDQIDRLNKNARALPPYQMRQVNGDIKKLPGVEVGSIENKNLEGVVGETIPEVSLFGSLAENLEDINPDEVLTYDPAKGGIENLASLVKEKKTFIITNNGDRDQRILAKSDALGNYTFLVKVKLEDDDGNIYEDYVDFKEANALSQEFKLFYQNVTKAFSSGFVKKMYEYAQVTR